MNKKMESISYYDCQNNGHLKTRMFITVVFFFFFFFFFFGLLWGVFVKEAGVCK